MTAKRPNAIVRLFLALIIASTLGLLMVYAARERARQINESPKALGQKIQEDREQTRELLSKPIDNAAWRYAQTVQRGDWEEAVRQTAWMQERLTHVRLTSDRPGAPEIARKELIERISDRTPVDNQLREEGVEDQYVFAPGAELKAVAVDAGRDDLEQPVAGRTWIRVRFPSKNRALRDEKSVPIHSLQVGVNITQDNQVLKANVIGNLDIDTDSIEYNWE